MSRWTNITIANLNNAKIAALVTSLRTAALGEGQDERSAEIIQGTVDRVRRKIASNVRNRLDADVTTIPQGLKDDVIKLIIADLKNALEEDLTPAEINELARINADLNRIAAGTDVVEQPDDAIDAPVEAAASTPSIGHVRRHRERR